MEEAFLPISVFQSRRMTELSPGSTVRMSSSAGTWTGSLLAGLWRERLGWTRLRVTRCLAKNAVILLCRSACLRCAECPVSKAFTIEFNYFKCTVASKRSLRDGFDGKWHFLRTEFFFERILVLNSLFATLIYLGNFGLIFLLSFLSVSFVNVLLLGIFDLLLCLCRAIGLLFKSWPK